MTTRHGRTAAARTARIQASPQFNGRTFANTYPVSTGLKPGVERPSLRDFLCGGERRVPSAPLPLAVSVTSKPASARLGSVPNFTPKRRSSGSVVSGAAGSGNVAVVVIVFTHSVLRTSVSVSPEPGATRSAPCVNSVVPAAYFWR